MIDNRAVRDWVMTHPWCDADSYVLYGGSAGGHIALELSVDDGFAAAVLGEPATVCTTGVVTRMSAKEPCMSDPLPCYTPQLRASTEVKISAIQTPMLVFHGDIHPLKECNNLIIKPAFDEFGTDCEWNVWDGKPHGFYWGESMTADDMTNLMDQVETFIKPKIRTEAAPWFD